MDYSTAGSQPSTLKIIIEVAICLLVLISEWRLFTKADQHGWTVLIPFYNVWDYYKFLCGRGKAMFRLLIPFYSIYWAIKSDIKLAHAYGKSTGFGWGIVFLPYIFIPILGLGKAEYAGVQDM